MRKVFILFICLFSCFMISCSTTSSKELDYDLSKQNMMNFTTLQNVMTGKNYNSYLGKTFKITGQFYKSTYGSSTYYLVSFADPSPQKCCAAQDMEFVLDNGKYPKEEGKTITVFGTLQKYTEGGKEYIHLVDAKLC